MSAVLIIDENRGVAEPLQRYLAEQGVDAAVVADAEAAVEAATAHRPRVALVASTLGGGAPALIRRLREVPQGDRIEVLILSTARPTARLQKEAREAGAAGLIPKLQGPRAVYDRVRRLLPARPTRAAGPPVVPVRPDGRGGGGVKPEVAAALASTPKRAASSRPGIDDLMWDPTLGAAGHEARGMTPAQTGPHVERGLMHAQSGNFEKAAAEFSHAKSMDPSNPIPQAWWAHCKRLTAGRKPDPDGDLADTLKMVTIMAPDLVEGHLFLGLLYEHAQRPQRARACFQEALRLKPGHAEARAALERISRQRHAEQ